MTGIAIILSVAAMLTGKPGTQVSPDMSMCRGDYGCADISGAVIHIESDMLWELQGLDQVLPYQGALAVFVFCHEARHVRGTTDELVADRWAEYHATTVARLLGASRAWVQRMRPWVRWWDLLLGGKPLPGRAPS